MFAFEMIVTLFRHLANLHEMFSSRYPADDPEINSLNCPISYFLIHCADRTYNSYWTLPNKGTTVSSANW